MELLQRWLINKTIDGVWEDSSQLFCLALNTTLCNIIIFIYYLICNLALTRLYICIELYHAKSKSSTHKHKHKHKPLTKLSLYVKVNIS